MTYAGSRRSLRVSTALSGGVLAAMLMLQPAPAAAQSGPNDVNIASGTTTIAAGQRLNVNNLVINGGNLFFDRDVYSVDGLQTLLQAGGRFGRDYNLSGGQIPINDPSSVRTISVQNGSITNGSVFSVGQMTIGQGGTFSGLAAAVVRNTPMSYGTFGPETYFKVQAGGTLTSDVYFESGTYGDIRLEGGTINGRFYAASGEITKSTSGTVTFIGTGTSNMQLRLNGGTVVLSGSGRASTGGIFFSDPNAVLHLQISQHTFNNPIYAVAPKAGVIRFDDGDLTLGDTQGFTGRFSLGGGTLHVGPSSNARALEFTTNGGTAPTFDPGANAASFWGISGGRPGALAPTIAGTGAITINVAEYNYLASNVKIGGVGRTLTKTGAGEQTLSGDLSYTGLTNVQGGKLVLSGNNSLTGGITVAGSTLVLGSAAAAGLATNTIALDGGRLELFNGSTLSNPFTLKGANTLFLQGTNAAVSLQGAISDGTAAGSLVKEGNFTLTLGGTNTYSGGTNILEGNVIATSASAFGTGNVSIAPRTQNALASVVYLDVADGATMANSFSSSSGPGIKGTLIKVGEGTLTLTGTNTTTGLHVSSGTLILANNAIGNFYGTKIISPGAALGLSNGVSVSTEELVLGNYQSGAAGVATLRNVSGNNAIGGGIMLGSNPDGVTPAYARIDSESGTLTVNSTIQRSVFNNAVQSLTLGGTGGTINLATSFVLGGALTKDGGSTAIVTADVATGSGENTNITGGRLQIGNDGTRGSLTTTSVVTGQGAALSFNRSDNINFSTPISGSGGVIQYGSGVLTLSGANTYTGGTSAMRGSIVIDGPTSTTSLSTARWTPNMAVIPNIVVQGTQDYTLSASILDATQLYKRGTNTVTWTGGETNTTSAAIAIYEGTLRINRSPAASQRVVTQLFVSQGATLITNLPSQVASDINSLQVWQGGTYRKEGSETVRVQSLSGSGQIRVAEGTLAIAQDSFNGAVITHSNNVAIDAGATLQFMRAPTNSADSTIFAGNITGAGRVVKSGTTTVTLTGTNTYSGDTIVEAGTLIIGAASALSPNTRVNVMAGATFNPGNFTLTVSELTGSGDVGGTGAVNVNSTTNATFAGVITGDRDLIKDGTGNQTLSGNLVYTGQTQIKGGKLTLTGNNLLPGGIVISGAGNLVIGSNNAANGATIRMTGSTTTILDTITNAAPVVIASNTSKFDVPNGFGTQSGVISEDQAGRPMEKIGFGTLALTAANTYSGVTTITAGTLQLGTGGTTGSLGGGDIVNNGALAFNRSDDLTVSGAISGTGTVRQNGLGNTTLSGALTYAGATFVNSGTLTLANPNGPNTISGGIVMATGARLMIGSSGAAGTGPIIAQGSLISYANGVTSAAPIRIAGNTTQLEVSGGGIATQTGVISEMDQPRPLEKIGTGTLVLTAANTHTGLTTISAGALNIQNATGLGTTAAGTIVAAGAALQLQGGITVGAEALTLNGTGVAGDGALRNVSGLNFYLGAVTLASATRINADSGVLTLQGTITNGGNPLTVGGAGNVIAEVITGTGGLTKDGGGTLELRGATSYTGTTTVNAGSLALANGSALADTGAVVVNAPGNLTIRAGGAEVIGSLAGGGTVTLNATLTTGGTNASTAFAGAISGTGGLTKAGSGTFTLTGANSFDGQTTITAGALHVGAGGTAGTLGAGAVAVAAGGTLAFNRSDAVTAANTITGAGTINHVGTGTTVLTGSSAAFAGTTNINAGILRVNGTLGGTVNVNAGGTLQGLGTAGGNVNVAAGGTLAAGASPGTLAIGGNLALGAGAISSFELGQANAIGGTNNDLVNVAGNLTLGGTLNVVSVAPGFSNGFYRLYNYGGALTNNTLAVGTLPAGFTSAGTPVRVLTGLPGQVNLQVGAIVDQFWDGTSLSGNGVINGGAGTWNATNTNWTNSPGGNFNTTWQSVNGTFSGAAGGTVTVVGAQAFQQLNFTTAGYTLDSGAFGSLRTTGGFSIINTVADVVINAPITGTGGLTKTGAGVLTLGPSSYQGATDIVGGTLRTVFTNALPTNTAVTISTGATLDVTGIAGFGGQTIGSLASAVGGTGAVVLGAGTLTTGGNNTSTAFAGVISGTGGLNKVGTGTFTLSGINTFTGRSVVEAGTLVNAGRMAGAVITGAAGTFANQTGATAGAIDNQGTGSNAGTVASLTNSTGTFSNTGTISMGATVTGGLVTNAAPGVINNGLTLNSGTFVNTGTLNGGATIRNGRLNTNGVLNGGISIFRFSNPSVSLAASGQLNGPIENNSLGIISLNGPTTGIGAVVQNTLASFDLGGFNTSFGSLAGAGFVALGAGTLTTGADNTSTSFAGLIVGTGGLVKTGTGVFTLTGNNTYSGGTTVQAGTLAGAVGSFGSGPLTTNAVLQFEQPTNATLAAAVSGTGTVLKTGAGELTFTGANTYRGGTTVTGGTLRGAMGPIQGNVGVGAAGALTLDQPTDATFSGILSGTGVFQKLGAGRLDMTAANTFTGTTSILAGNLAVNGSLAGSVLVGNGATLSGTGTVGSTTVSPGGTLAPGNSVGTLNVAGNLALSAGSTFEVEVNPTAADRVNVAGTASLAGRLSVTRAAGSYAFFTRYTLINAAAGRTGTFDSTVFSAAFSAAIRPTLSYDANNVFLTLDPNAVQPLLGATPVSRNITNTVSGFDRSVQALELSALPFTSLFNLPAAQIPAAMNQLSGEAHATLAGRAIEDFRLVREAVLKQSGTALPQGLHVWGQAFSNLGRVGTDGNAATSSIRTGGFVLGIEAATGDGIKVGGFGAFTSTSLRASAVGSTGTAENLQAGLSAAGQFGALGVRAGASYGGIEGKLTRRVGFTGFSDTLTSTNHHKAAQAFAETSWMFGSAGRSVEAFAQVAGLKFWGDSFIENGGVARLAGRVNDANLGYTTLGARGIYVLVTEGGSQVTFKGSVGWRHSFGDVLPSSTVRFAGTQQTFHTYGVATGRNAAVVEGSVDWALNQNATLGLSYSGMLANRSQEHALKGQFGLKF